ncbi:MAG: hypothetical protein OEP48_04535 [Betaproteobacteria bacterium]|nr:hypothetical protein [Betaproteobacteria bacterium]MDH3436417.1 hypothetical protein [Betaproteobacteria bacterium]
MKHFEPKEAYAFLKNNLNTIFIDCRSGNRSLDVGRALEEAGFTHVYNVLHGFEGELEEDHHRNAKTG